MNSKADKGREHISYKGILTNEIEDNITYFHKEYRRKYKTKDLEQWNTFYYKQITFWRRAVTVSI